MAIELRGQTPLTLAQLDNNDRIMVIDQNDTVVAITTLEILAEWIGCALTPDGIKGLRDELNNRALSVHTHTISDITDLQNRLDEKLDASLANIVGNTIQIKDRTITIPTATSGAEDARIPDMVTSGNYLRFLGTDGTIEERTIQQVRSDLMINNVDNTSDVDKPISTATQTALDGKLNKPDGNPAVTSFVSVASDGTVTYTNATGVTNLSIDRTSNEVTVVSSTGVDGVIQAATTNLAGVMSSADKTKLDGIENLADVTDTENVYAALGITPEGSVTRFLSQRGVFVPVPVVTQVIPGTGGIGKGNVLPTSPMMGELFALTEEDTAAAGGPYQRGIYCYDGANWIEIGGAGGQITVEDEGIPLTDAATILDFVGSGVTATNNNGEVTVSIDAAGETQYQNTQTITVLGNRTNVISGSVDEIVRISINSGFVAPTDIAPGYEANWEGQFPDEQLETASLGGTRQTVEVIFADGSETGDSHDEIIHAEGEVIRLAAPSTRAQHFQSILNQLVNQPLRITSVFRRRPVQGLPGVGDYVTITAADTTSLTAGSISFFPRIFGDITGGGTDFTLGFDRTGLRGLLEVHDNRSIHRPNSPTISEISDADIDTNRQSTFNFDPDTEDTVYSTDTGTVNIPENSNATQTITQIANAIAALDTNITWDGVVNTIPGSVFVDINLGTTQNISSGYDFVSDLPGAQVSFLTNVNEGDPNEQTTLVQVFTPDGNVLTSRTYSVGGDTDTNFNEVLADIRNDIENFSDEYTTRVDGRTITVVSGWTSTEQNPWDVSVDNRTNSNPGNITISATIPFVDIRSLFENSVGIRGNLEVEQDVTLSGLPLTNPEISGRLWNNGGVVNISTPETGGFAGVGSITLSNFVFSEGIETATVTVTGTPGVNVLLSITNTVPAGWLTSGALGATTGVLDMDGRFETLITIPTSLTSTHREARVRAVNSADSTNFVNTLPFRQVIDHGVDGDLFVSFVIDVNTFDLMPNATITGGDAPFTLELFDADPTMGTPTAIETITRTESASITSPVNVSFNTITVMPGAHTYYLRVSDSGTGDDNNVVIEPETVVIADPQTNFIDDVTAFDRIFIFVLRDTSGLDKSLLRLTLTSSAESNTFNPNTPDDQISDVVIFFVGQTNELGVPSGTTEEIDYEVTRTDTSAVVESGTLNFRNALLSTQQDFDDRFEFTGASARASGFQNNVTFEIYGDVFESAISESTWVWVGDNDGSDTSTADFTRSSNQSRFRGSITLSTTTPAADLGSGIYTIRADVTAGTTTRSAVYTISVTVP